MEINRGHYFRSGLRIYLLTYLLTPWCRILLEKLTGFQLVKKFPEFHGTRRFITALTSVRHLSLSWASPIQSTYPHPTSWRSVLILSTHLAAYVYIAAKHVKSYYSKVMLQITRFQASAAKYMRTALFWAVTKREVVIPYRRFGTAYRSHLQGSRRRDR